MRNITTPDLIYLTDDQSIKTFDNLSGRSSDLYEKHQLHDFPTTEAGASFSEYMRKLGLKNTDSTIVLTPQHHYYYDEEELKNVGTIINLKELNYIRDLRNFIMSISLLLPQKSNFIGCFSDSRRMRFLETGYNLFPRHKRSEYEYLKDNGVFSGIPLIDYIYNFMDSRISRYLTSGSVSELLTENGFILLDMTETEGLTFFHAEKQVKNNRVMKLD
jgi:hypothetical protein